MRNRAYDSRQYQLKGLANKGETESYILLIGEGKNDSLKKIRNRENTRRRAAQEKELEEQKTAFDVGRGGEQISKSRDWSITDASLQLGRIIL